MASHTKVARNVSAKKPGCPPERYTRPAPLTWAAMAPSLASRGRSRPGSRPRRRAVAPGRDPGRATFPRRADRRARRQWRVARSAEAARRGDLLRSRPFEGGTLPIRPGPAGRGPMFAHAIPTASRSADSSSRDRRLANPLLGSSHNTGGPRGPGALAVLGGVLVARFRADVTVRESRTEDGHDLGPRDRVEA